MTISKEAKKRLKKPMKTSAAKAKKGGGCQLTTGLTPGGAQCTNNSEFENGRHYNE